MTSAIKLIALADVHHGAEKWEQLVEAVHLHRPDVVAVSGDLIPREHGTLAQVDYLPQVREYAAQIKAAGAELVLILGNDDNQQLVPAFVRGDDEGLWHYVADRVKRVKGYDYCGCPWIRDYPFAYKYWVAPESVEELYISDLQLGPPLLINDQNELEEIPDLYAYLKKKQPINAVLEELAGQVADLKRSIWLIHEPPATLGFDHCASGDKVGSPVVLDFISTRQPLLTIHGHIHEAPRFNGGIWSARVGCTTAIQAGQHDDRLSYVILAIENDRVISLEHSIYGRNDQQPLGD